MQPVYPAPAAGKPGTVNWPLRGLLILGVGLLLGWLSVGLPQATPLLLLRTLLQFKALQAQIGIAALGALALLTVQTLLILAAWGLFLWVAIREMRAFFSSQTAASHPTPPLYPPAQMAYPPAQAFPAVADMPTAVAPPPLAHADQDNPFESQDSSQHRAVAYSAPSLSEAPTRYATPPAASDKPTGIASKQTRQASIPQELQQDEDSVPTLLIRPQLTEAEPEPEQKARQQVTEEDEAERTVIKTDMLAKAVAEMKASRQQMVESMSGPVVDALAAPPASASKAPVPSVEPQKTASSEVPPEKEKTRTAKGIRQSDHSMTATDPYAVQPDPYAVQVDLFESLPEEEEEDEKPSEPSAQRPEESSFIFGNPFDGPLPDVFEHDEDLKRALQQEKASPKGPKAPEQK